MNLGTIRTQLTDLFLADLSHEHVPQDLYTNFSYPKLIKLMRFNTDRYKVSSFGHFMTMHTKTVFGMELLTASFMPSEGVSVPYLLIDMMTVGKKRTVFVEYYDCTADHPDLKRLAAVHEKYDSLTAYAEKPHWYVSERMPYSLIKCGSSDDDDSLTAMIMDSVKAYCEENQAASRCMDNLPGLKGFQERMILEGNPSSSVLEKVFGKEGSAEFFKKCVMPI